MQKSARLFLDILILIRPKHWVKNLLVFAAPFFFFLFTSVALERALWAFLGFSVLSSGVYVINDLLDARSDTNHPVRKDRPIASGKISPKQAISIAVIFLALSYLIFQYLGSETLVVAAIYLAINIFYSLLLKRIIVVDAVAVALGFVLRVLAGSTAVGIGVTNWLLVCTFFLALFFAFGKRKHEILGRTDETADRKANKYTKEFINQMIFLTAGIAVILYSLYSIDPNVVAHFGAGGLVLTIPIVIFGIFRYLFLLQTKKAADPIDLFVRDWLMVIDLVVWIAAILTIHYY
jgi:4-hydroxybenzoate polyprenyltransferase